MGLDGDMNMGFGDRESVSLDGEIVDAERRLREGIGWGRVIRLASLKMRSGDDSLAKAIGLKEPLPLKEHSREYVLNHVLGLAVRWAAERPGREFKVRNGADATGYGDRDDFICEFKTVDLLGSSNARRAALRIRISRRDEPELMESKMLRGIEEMTRNEFEREFQDDPTGPSRQSLGGGRFA